jgi:hypothetical protein
MTINSDIQSLLNIGSSSTMFKRESQWPNINKLIQSTNHIWKQLRMKLLQEPLVKDRAVVTNYDDCCQLVKVDMDSMGNHGGERMTTKFAKVFEQGNRPAKIMGATAGWKCMPQNQDVTVRDAERYEKRSWT